MSRRANRRPEISHAVLCRRPGPSLIHESNGMVRFEVSSGQLFEVFGPESRYYQLHACPVLAFQVERMCARPGRSSSHGVSSSPQISVVTTQRLGLIFAGPTAIYTSFGDGTPLESVATQLAAETRGRGRPRHTNPLPHRLSRNIRGLDA